MLKILEFWARLWVRYEKLLRFILECPLTIKKKKDTLLNFKKEKLRAYCKAMDMMVHDVFIDPAYSGSNLNRPALQSLISRINEFDAVIVYKLDRLSRSQKDTLYLIEDVFIPNNVAFISISESI